MRTAHLPVAIAGLQKGRILVAGGVQKAANAFTLKDDRR